MADQWFYRMFGHEFGPVPLAKLKELAEVGTVSADDEVRSANSSQWVAASSVSELGLGVASTQTAVAVAQLSGTDADLQAIKTGADDWYCKVHGQELGPLSFDELVKFAAHEHLSADDEVKLGAKGKWRRVGSMGRLMAVLPYQVFDRKTPAPATKSKAPASEQPISSAAPTPAPVAVAEEALATAQTAYQATYDQAMTLIAWAFAPNVDPYWWSWIGGVEYGPVDFRQVWTWTTKGQLQATDFVRNGQYGQYVPAANIPGLYHAAGMVAQAMAELSAAQAQLQAASALAAAALSPTSGPVQALASVKPTEIAVVPQPKKEAAPTKPIPSTDKLSKETSKVTEPVKSEVPKSESTRVEAPKLEPSKAAAASTATSTPAVEKAPAPVVEPEPIRPAVASSSMGGGFSSSMSSSGSFATPRPATPPPRPAAKPSTSSGPSFSMPDFSAMLSDPKLLGALGALALLLIIVGWQYLPKASGADIKHYHELKHILDEIRVKRSSKSSDFAAIATQAERATKEITSALKDTASRDYPAKQYLLWAARDELPRLMTALRQNPTATSKEEEVFATRLKDAARELGVQ